jgi:inhibitor of KinA
MTARSRMAPIFPRVEVTGDAALTLRFGDSLAPDIHDQVLTFVAAVEHSRPAWIVEIVPTAHSVTVLLPPGTACRSPARWLASLAWTAARTASRRRAGRLISVPVFYGGRNGPDLEEVATFAGLTPRDAIRLHSGTEYRVYFLGFAPGFPYLGTVPEPIAMPRLATPRARVPAGSVGIAGGQTGIYPDDSPGGWRIIGRTPLRLYDAERQPPFLFRPGDRVRFIESV